MTSVEPLLRLEPGMRILVGNDGILTVDARLAEAFQPGDALFVVPGRGEVLHLPRAARQSAHAAVSTAVGAVPGLRQASDTQIQAFFGAFAARLADERLWGQIQAENARDVERAQARGRSTTRLEASPAMRKGMIDGLRAWQSARSMRGRSTGRRHGT